MSILALIGVGILGFVMIFCTIGLVISLINDDSQDMHLS